MSLPPHENVAVGIQTAQLKYAPVMANQELRSMETFWFPSLNEREIIFNCSVTIYGGNLSQPGTASLYDVMFSISRYGETHVRQRTIALENYSEMLQHDVGLKPTHTLPFFENAPKNHGFCGISAV